MMPQCSEKRSSVSANASANHQISDSGDGRSERKITCEPGHRPYGRLDKVPLYRCLWPVDQRVLPVPRKAERMFRHFVHPLPAHSFAPLSQTVA